MCNQVFIAIILFFILTLFCLNQGHVLTTGAPGDEEKGYFRLHINEYNNIETITCVCKQVRPSALTGKTDPQVRILVR